MDGTVVFSDDLRYRCSDIEKIESSVIAGKLFVELPLLNGDKVTGKIINIQINQIKAIIF